MNRISLSLLAFMVTFVAHAVAQFVSWSAADAIHPLWFGDKAFSVLSFPTFYVASEALATAWFWPIFMANSLLWALAAGAAVALLSRPRRTTAPPN